MSSTDKFDTKQLATSPQHSIGPVDERDGNSPFPIVAVGASAGGIEACQQLLANLPTDTGMAFIFVQHLDPTHESKLAEVLGSSTAMPVVQTTHGMVIEPNHVYVIPPNANLGIAAGRIQITPRPAGRGLHLPINFVFRALAEDQKSRAIGVVLSGTGSDGTQGLCEIKAVAGITFAQAEESARHSGMPHSAVESGCVDFVLSPEEIARRLGQIGSHPYLIPQEPSPKKELDAENYYRTILASVRHVTGVDFSLYRDTTIKRRILRRMALHTERSLESYARRLEADPLEVEALYHDLLINVTGFFRDDELFETLKEKIYPEIVKNKSLLTPVRIWVPGCSTGQEAYSIAMTLSEFFDDKPVRPPIQIFASDLSDARSLEKARAGLYPESIEAEVSTERLKRFFQKEDHLYRINKIIRDMCVFARQNIIADPPFSHVDLISCRNVLIYLAPVLQKRVLPTFHYALNFPGFLVLGTAESVGENTDLFEMVDRANKIYSKKTARTQPHIKFLVDDYGSAWSLPTRRGKPAASAPVDFQREADRILLTRYSPPGVLVNQNLDIIQFRGRTSPYLEPPPGEPTTNLLKMAREGLFLELRSAIADVARQKRPVRRDNVRVRSDSGARQVNLEVLPVTPPGTGEQSFLVLFHDAEVAPNNAEVKSAESIQRLPSLPDSGMGAGQVAQLERELTATKDYLQSLVEQQDAVNEELRSANEEILSSNEELQSTNEELETAKEELQSTNEELITVNEQLQFRNLELNQLTNDLTNLLTSTSIPVIMVGPDLRIRRFTAAARRAMNIVTNDVGRPIDDFNLNIDVPDLKELILEVVDEVQVREREVLDREGRWHRLRVHPYRTADNKIDGAVILLLDIDDMKRSQDALRRSEERLRLALEGGSLGIWYRDLQTGELYWDDQTNGIFGLPPDADRNEATFFGRVYDGDREKFNNALQRALRGGGEYAEELRIMRPDGGIRWVLMTAKPIYDASALPVRMSGVCLDVTERKRLEEELKQSVTELREADRKKNEFIATLSHELRNPLAPILNAVEILRRHGSSDEQREWCREVIYRQVKQMSRLMDDLLDVARIARDKLELRKERVELANVIEAAIETSRPQIEAAGQKLTVTLPPERIWLDADPTRLAQVFSNLLNNAAKYVNVEGQIWLTAERQEDQAVVSVKDTGIGIPQELLSSIFEMFVQGRHGPEQHYGGLGLGLTLARELVRMHGGSIEAKSEGEGLGSEFIVRLPITEALPAAARPEFQLTDRRPCRPVKRILVVDDSAVQAKSFAMLLEMADYEVRAAPDAPDALKVLDEFVPDVAIIDIGLPGMSGNDLARRIREQPRFEHMILVAQTGWGREEDRRCAELAGFDYHMVKPVEPEEVLKLLARLGMD